jgi:drug/metabolite transporter (DMT)-like permease
MIFKTRIPVALTLGLALAIALDTSVQLILKITASHIPTASSQWETLEATLHQPLFFAAALLMVMQLFNWLQVLGRADLSFAQPITSLTYVSVYALSGLYLDEKLDTLQILGIAIILAGVWCISRTGSMQSDAEVTPK